MFDISNEGNIQLIRGDSLSLALFINKGNELYPVRYDLTDDDTVYFALMEDGQLFENAILKKMYTSKNAQTKEGDLIISLSTEDTQNLREGLYKYTIKLRTKNEDTGEYQVDTVVTEHNFYVMN